MPLIKHLIKFIISVSLLILSQTIIASVFDAKCGKYTFVVKIKKTEDDMYSHFDLYFNKKNQKKILFYKTKIIFNLNAACVQNKQKKYLMIFIESYGGNAAPEDMYGVFDPDSGEMIIKPSDWPKGNSKAVEQILGYPPPFFNDTNRAIFFCCSKKFSQNKKW